MIYIFDKTQAIIKVLTNDDFTAAHLNFKINTATTFEFSLPASKALPSGSKYVATPHPLDDSKFIMLRLTERVDNTETIDYSAYELAYQELATDGYIEDKRPQNQSALNLMKIALDGSNWELNNVNVSGAATTNFYYVDRLSAISKVVDLLGGEIVFYIEIQGNAISGRYMDYLARQGADTSKVFASGSNLLTVERQSDTSNIYTAILPRGKGEEIDNGDADTPDGYGRRINIADVEWKKSSGKPLDKPKGSIVLSDPDATTEWGQINGNARLLLQTYDDIDDVNVLINSAYKTLQSVNHPQIQYSATVADVGGLSLGDTVLIMHGDRNLSYKTRVFEVKYDLLSPDQTELSLGDDLSSNSITSQLNSLNAVADATSSQTQWTINQIGRPSTTFGNTEPANPKVGDVFFKELPDGGTEIYRWNGDIWELLASPTTADDIATAVDDAVAQAKAHVEEVKQGLSSDITTATSQAASQASTAEANAKSAATSQFTQAQSALSAAKSDLTNSIASEASARNAAVSAANSQAQTYANQAKADAMSAASSADGVIRTAISSSANSLSATITQNKSSADSGISTAQTTAQAAVDGLKFKVSQTDYNTKTGQLQTDLTATTQTANQAKTDIVSIKQKDGDQDARMTTIESDASGVKTTVSDLKTAQGKQSGDISTLQQRADGFDATVTKVDNLAIGSRNYVLGTKNALSWSGTGAYNQASDDSDTTNIYTINRTALGHSVMISYDLTIDSDMSSTASIGLQFYSYPNWDQFVIRGTHNSGTYKFNQTYSIPSDIKPTQEVIVRGIANGYTGNISISNVKIEIGNVVTDWTPAPEDLSGATAKAQLTADQATLSINNYKTDADGRISKAQADIKLNADAISTKVAKTDYDKKTGELSGSISTLQQRADGFDVTVTKVDNLSVGGRNLLQGTRDFSGSNWLNLGNIWTKTDETYNGLSVVETTNDWGGISQYYQVKQGETYTFSLFARYTSGTGTSNFYISLNSDPENGYKNAPVDNLKLACSLDANWKKYSITFTATTDGYIKPRMERADTNTNILRVCGLMLEKGTVSTDWTPAPEDIESDIAQVKSTADSISNFVRDSSGNISSDFQTALSKTSIITGSTLATSIQTQTSSQIASALTDNNGKIISLINQDTSGVQIAGKNIVLNGDTTVTGDFYAKGGNFKNLNASNITVGTLNGTQVNITNINANNIMTGKLNALFLTGSTAYLNSVNTGTIVNTVDDQLQISAKNMYYQAQNSAQLTLFSSNSDLGDLDKGSIKYIDNSMPYGQQEGLRFKGKSIQAISPDGGSPHLYLMPYNNGELRVTLRGSNYSSYADLRANKITSGNIWLNANHSIYSQDNGKMYFLGGGGNAIDLGVRSLTQSSLVSLKENIRNVETDHALAEVLKSDIRQYNFKTDDKQAVHISPMIDDVDGKLYIPNDWVSSDGDSVDTYNIIGYLIQAVKELNKKIEQLESKGK